jgi:hypothetical protein
MAQGNYISNTLVHWTGRGKDDEKSFEILKSIISKQIIYLSYCPNFATPIDQSTTRDNINDKRTMMVCFTDLPLKYSKEFCSKFGTFGVGFKKTKMIEYGANPVLYTTAKHLERIKSTNSLINQLLSEEVDRVWKDAKLNNDVGDRYQFTSEQLYALNDLFGFTQEFSYKERDENYYQREWRLNYETLPFEAGKGVEKVGYGGMHGLVDGKFMCEMKFSLNDIDYVILPKSFFKRKKEINELSNDKFLIYEVEVEKKWWKRFI